jgi:spoIIIJ-associated protein
MEWVETTGRTVEEAKDRALDQLGVDEDDAEFDIVEEPRPGLFGRMRGEARVRARVRPTQPRPKVERRDRGRRRGEGGRQRSRRGGTTGPSSGGRGATPGGSGTATATDPSGDDGAAKGTGDAPRSRSRSRGRRGGRSRGGKGTGGDRTTASGERDGRSRDEGQQNEGDEVTEIDLGRQETIVADFLRGLVDAFGVDATVATKLVDEDEAVEAAVDGNELGLLVGPKGVTLQSVQELARSVVQRKMPGERHGRIRIDVAGYRERRRVALERFTQQVAQEVLDSGQRKALEPMAPPDRKVVHDTVNAIDGVATVSEGEEPRRRVVILPASEA